MNLDVIILFVFLISVAYVIYQAINSLGKQTKIALDRANLDAQLAEKEFDGTPLSSIVTLNFKFGHRYAFTEDPKNPKGDQQPKEMLMILINKSGTASVYVDWDKSTLTDYNRAARRAIRLNGQKQVVGTAPPGSQIPTKISPGDTLGVFFTAEPLLGPDDEKKVLQAQKPIVDLLELQAKAKDRKTPAAVKEKNLLFRIREKPLEFFFVLAMRVAVTNGSSREQAYQLSCRFTVENMHWFDQMPWNPIPD